MKQALVELELEPHQVLFVSGIGQAAKLPQYLKSNFFNGLHGRSLPVAIGAKIANHELTVLIVGGDGDGYGEGGNHLIHGIRRNLDITYDWISDEELTANPELVKTMSVKPPMGHGKVRLIRVQDCDLQPCGGTHVQNTLEIGAVRVRKIEKKGKQNRRVSIEFVD